MRTAIALFATVLLTVTPSVTHQVAASDFNEREFIENLLKSLDEEPSDANKDTDDSKTNENISLNYLTEWGNIIRAAYNGDIDAQAALGQAHMQGLGAPKNSIRAYMWLNLAAAQGNSSSARERDLLADGMTEGQIASAEQLSTELWERLSLAEIMGWSRNWWELHAARLVLNR